MKKKNAKLFRPTAFAIPYIVVTIVFVIVPLILILIYSFRGADGSFTVENFKTVFTQKETLTQLGKTLEIAIVSTIICLLLAYPTAYILASAPFNKVAILSLFFIIPMWINFMLRMFALKSLLHMIGINEGFWPAVIGIIYDFFPYMLLPIYTVLSNMDKSYIEASRDLGANGAKTFVSVTLPLSLPGVISGISMMFMPIFSSYAITQMLGDMNTTVIGSKIASLFQNQNYGDYGYGSALSFVLLIIVLVTMLIFNFLSKKTQKSSKGGKKA
ncbi:MAG: ABC transporter permease [Clostridia bacterium]|nr:ABC transporter permease [Clostridia bacterium]